ncbi:transketolase [Planctomyces sp. SH-PL62]|uniref:transketolase n=1 Tax=Planctomyces sp. SH-PL62 TaxID=1636152 RepID=UPI00078C7D31|nr:transketolase [Planctomyces sp. SH-PL62]AMV38977.1 Transketolase [Planctomyces sp. SH-PL62]
MSSPVNQQPVTAVDDPMDKTCIDTIRTLAMDAVQKANSGHPGTPMALAPVAYLLWQKHLRYDPTEPIWPNRDRFVLSAGHASMLLYSLLHLAEVQAVDEDYETLGKPSVSLDDIKNFRQIHSHTPGHPEYRLTSGVETTTGPLGQGVANSVGMAIAQRWLGARYNKPGFEDLIDFNVYAICSDGDMMEGISHEAASLAGHLKLSNLCWIYDDNRITIEGSTELTYGDDVAERFLGYGWNVTRVGDANDLRLLERAYDAFIHCDDRPTLIIVDSHIAWGSPNKQDTSGAHGEPLGEEEIRLTKRVYGWPEDAKFLVPDGVYEHFRNGIGARGKDLREAWFKKLDAYKAKHPDLAEELDQIQRRQLPDGWDKDLPTFPADPKGVASRESSGKVLNAVAKNLPWLIGGSADLAPSTKTLIKDAASFEADDYAGRNFHFGIREHAMGAILNGMSTVKLRPYGAGFLIFSDYGRAPIRLAALMELPVIYVFTHDSIGVGEDGPTHQPIEQLPSLRAIPGLIVIRPCDANEVVEAWRTIIPFRRKPVALIMTRQAIPTLDRETYAPASGLARGAYVLADSADGGKPDVILIGTGSEVSLCIGAFEKLKAEGVKARVVSMPSWELFDDQDQAYQDEVFPPDVEARVSVEQASTFGWAKYVGRKGATIGMKSFGASAPLKDLLKEFGFTVDRVYEAARDQLAKYAR